MKAILCARWRTRSTPSARRGGERHNDERQRPPQRRQRTAQHGDPGASSLPPAILDDLREKLAPIMAGMSARLDEMSARLDERMSALTEREDEKVGENLELFRRLMTMAEDMAREHAERMGRIETPIVDRLEKQHHEIEAMKRRLDALEAGVR